MSSSQPGPCACTQIRRTARKITSFYDGFLEPSGLTITQYAILAKIGRAETISHSALADLLGMDRTTLTRNLKLLEQERFITTCEGDDRRQRLLSLSASGKRKWRHSLPLWEQAQYAFSAQFGAEALDELGRLLTAVETTCAAGKVP